MVPQAAPLDFYGSHICIRSGRVVVPGGSAAAPLWKELVGASPDSPGEFIPKLFAKDSGWLAAYFDDLSSAPPSQESHLTEPARLRRFYEMFRGKIFSYTRTGVFRQDAGLFLLVIRLRWEPNGDLYVPGNVEVWKKIFRQKTDSKIIRDWGRRAAHWDHPDQLLDALFGISQVPTETGPLQSYLMLSELDGRRSPEHQVALQRACFRGHLRNPEQGVQQLIWVVPMCGAASPVADNFGIRLLSEDFLPDLHISRNV